MSELNYYELHYYVEKFAPTHPLHDRQDFLLRELTRRDRLNAESSDLYTYIHSGRTDQDQSLFAADPDLATTYATTIASATSSNTIRYEQTNASKIAFKCNFPFRIHFFSFLIQSAACVSIIFVIEAKAGRKKLRCRIFCTFIACQPETSY